MIPPDSFVPLLCSAIPRFRATRPNARQQVCLLHNPSVPLMIVAGPGSGKTTVLVLRALRLVFVDGLLPEHVVLTTFTKKAAAELRARLIEWGFLLRDYLRHTPPHPTPTGLSDWLDAVDINRFVTGTLDSICQEVLTTHRDPTDPAPVLVEGFVGNGILIQDALFPNQVHAHLPYLERYLTPFTFNGRPPSNFGEKVAICRTLLDRFIHDLVDVHLYENAPTHQQARRLLATCADSYLQSMQDSHRMDFPLLERTFLDRLQQGRLMRFTADLGALLVDEYQDTNPLQEQVYSTIINDTSASLTIVGDDDQSLYRFRGATVELFRDFPQRFPQLVRNSPPPRIEYLIENYRSTPEIVDFADAFVHGDPDFQPARVQPPKPQIISRKPSIGIPVLGMFRPDIETLADAVTDFLCRVFRGPGWPLRVNGQTVTIAKDPNGGDFGDAVLLAHTVNEYAAQFGGTPPRERLPRLLRTRLAQQQPPVHVFNPRGRLLRDIPVIQRLLGTILNCIDPVRSIQDALHLRAQARAHFNAWRESAVAFAASNPPPTSPHTLTDFIRAWRTHTPQAPQMQWPAEWPLLELCFKLLSWLPELQDDPEGQVYLEAVSRAIAQAATFSPYRGKVLFRPPPHNDNSVKAIIRDVLSPIAESSVDVDEDILPHVPRSHFPVMTIHQAKGLEYPLVIVDVSSDYRTNSPSNRFRRFPENPTSVQRMEDDLAQFCGIGPLRQARSGLQRAFDDLMRLYYVAYSRPECVLLLVGLDTCLRYNTSIRHVATGWRSDETWTWRNSVPAPPPLVNRHPLFLI